MVRRDVAAAVNRKGALARWLRYQYYRLLRINDTPEKTAGGLALGVVLGVLPTFGLGIIIALFAAGLFRVNRVSAVIGTLIVNPWTAPFFWALSYVAGSLVLGNELSETLEVIRELRSEGDLWVNLLGRRLLLPYVVGNVLVTAAAAAVSYVACLGTVKAYRKAKAKRRDRKRPRMQY